MYLSLFFQDLETQISLISSVFRCVSESAILAGVAPCRQCASMLLVIPPLGYVGARIVKVLWPSYIDSQKLQQVFPENCEVPEVGGPTTKTHLDKQWWLVKQKSYIPDANLIKSSTLVVLFAICCSFFCFSGSSWWVFINLSFVGSFEACCLGHQCLDDDGSIWGQLLLNAREWRWGWGLSVWT